MTSTYIWGEHNSTHTDWSLMRNNIIDTMHQVLYQGRNRQRKKQNYSQKANKSLEIKDDYPKKDKNFISLGSIFFDSPTFSTSADTSQKMTENDDK